MSIVIGGRSFRAGEVGREELLARTRHFSASSSVFTDDMSSWAYDVRLVEGDLVVDGPLGTFAAGLCGLVVTGRLIVRGCYVDYDDPETGTFVLGDMEAAHVVTDGWLNVGGSLLVHGGLIGYHNDCAAEIRGSTRAGFLHTSYHSFAFGGDVQVGTVLGAPTGTWPSSSTLQELPPSRYPDVLVPEVLDPEDRLEIDSEALIDRVQRDLPIFVDAAGTG